MESISMPRNTDTSAAIQWHREQKLLRIEEYMKNPKTCKYCNSPFSYGDTRKMFCNHSCASKFNNGLLYPDSSQNLKNKLCLQCGELTKSKYCSLICGIKYRKQDTINRWLSGEILTIKEVVPSTIRQYLFEKSENKCSRCGWNEINPITNKVPLTIDHIDGNASNHSPDNLQVLCPNCHSLTPTYGNLNKWNGRKLRYK